MSEPVMASRQPGGAGQPGGNPWSEGTLGRIAAFVYTVLVVEVMLVGAVLPGVVPLVLLDRDVSNLPLVAVCALPVGPALAAALYALHHRSHDLADLHPAAAFWRGYRVNFVDTLKIWVPCLAWLTIVAVNLAYFADANLPGWWAALLVAIGLGVTLWMVNALVITSLFTFRVRDLARLAAHFLAHTPGVTLSNTCLLIVAVGVTIFASEAVLLLLGAFFVLALLQSCRPMTTKVQEQFTA